MGRHCWTNRLTVEDCPLALDVLAFHRAGALICPADTTGTLKWTIPGELCPLGRLEYRVDQSGPTGLAIYIRRQCVRINLIVDEQRVSVATVRPHLGGERPWFACGCGRRVGRLYLPPGQRSFRCRHCHYLTYRSAREHDQRVYDLAQDADALILALRESERGNWKPVRLGFKAYLLSLTRHNRQRRAALRCLSRT
jgi:hypothetical protein